MKKATILAIEKLKSFLGIKTDYELAKKWNVPQSTVARYSKGKTSISLEKLNEFCEKENIELEINYKPKSKN
jgi:predicted transcriptional regulator